MTPTIILLEPQMGENIGAAARACANFGLSELRLVNPRDGWPNGRAEAMASGAFGFLEVRVFETLPEAIKDLSCVLATAAQLRDMVKPLYTPEGAVAHLSNHDGRTGLLFGRERCGLENEEIALCHGMITIPTNPEFSSLNLAQAVLLLGYEWIKKHDQTPDMQMMKGTSPYATGEELGNFLARLETGLEKSGFFRDPGLRPHVWRNITNIFSRSELTAQEVSTLQGVLSALLRR